MALTQKQMLEMFNQTGAMLKGHFILTSGRHSDTYMQCAKLFTNATVSQKICSTLAQELKNYKATVVVSPAVGGIIMGYEMSRHLSCTNIFFERENNKFSLRRGFELPKGTKVIVVEDVVTTGGSVIEVINCVRELGATVVAVASVVDRSGGKVDFGVPYKSLLSLDIQSYESTECPLCKENTIPAVKPGSRSIK